MEDDVMPDSIYHFRSALGGFHKGDVIGYIEKLVSRHRSELLDCEQKIVTLQEENTSLQQQINLLMMSTPIPSPEPTPEPTTEPTPEPTTEPITESNPAATDSPDLITLELQAYRRAEAVERNAANRAKKLYGQLESLYKEAIDEFQVTDSAVKQTIELVLAQAKALEESCQALGTALANSREKMAAMDELCSPPDDLPISE